MAITPLPPVPSRQDPTTFSDKADAFLGALPTFATEANALQSDVNSKQTTASTAATTATTQAEIAATAAATATTKATEASSSASAAASSASTALTAVGNASSSASVAIASKDIAVSAAADAVSAASSANALVLGVATGYPTIRPSLNLDFANSGQFDPRITFTRNSTATYFGSDGLLKTASANEPRIDHDPVTGECKGFLVEEARTNLLTYSEQFSNAAWNKSASSVTANAISAPDGTITADKVIENSTNIGHAIRINYAFAANTSYCASIYVKAGERTSGTFLVFDNNSNMGAWHINLLTGELAQGSVSLATTVKATNVGNGWWRISVSFVSSAAPSGSYFDFRLSNVWPITFPNGVSYTGDNTSGIYIWGAQLEANAFPTSYIPTPAIFTSRNSTATYFDSTGVMRTAAINEPRYDHGFVNGRWVSKGLVLEDSATNLVLNSEVIDLQSNVSILANDTLAPNNTLTMDRVVETATTGEHYPMDHTFTPTADATYTWSCFAKLPSGGAERKLMLRIASGNLASVYFSLSDGSSSGSGNPQYVSHGSAHVGGGIYRCWLTWRADSATSTICRTQLATTGNVFNYVGDGASGIYIWGKQLEAGTQPTSYIKTEATSVTRAADLSTSSAVTRAADSAAMTGSNFSSWYRQDEGSLLGVYSRNSDKASGNQLPLNVSDGTENNIIAITDGANGIADRVIVATNGVSQVNIGAINYTANQIIIRSFGYKLDNCATSANGAAVVADTSALIPVVNQLSIGFAPYFSASRINGHIRRLAYYPRRLTNDQLVALTQ